MWRAIECFDEARRLSGEILLNGGDDLVSLSDARALCESIELDLDTDLSSVVSLLEYYGPILFLKKNGQVNRLFRLWLRLWEDAALGSGKAEQRYRQITRALSKFTSGRRSLHEPEKRDTLRCICNAKHTVNRNRKWTAQRLVKEITRQASMLQGSSYGRSAEEAKKEAVRTVLDEWRNTSRAKNKNAIVALVKEFLNTS